MKKAFYLEGLDCANCAAKIENGIKALPGVTLATINFMTTKMIIEGDDAQFEQILRSANAIVKKIEPDVVVKKA